MGKTVAAFDPNYRPRLKNVEIESSEQLEKLLRSLAGRKTDPNVRLRNESGDELLISVMGEVACVVFGPGKRSRAPSMSASTAKSPSQGGKGDCFEFLVGGTPTPLPKDRCLSMETMLEIADHFYRTGNLPKSVTWAID